jgi:SAM-dependent methyltransferase
MESARLALQDVLEVGANKTSPQMVYFGAEARIGDVANFILPIEVVIGVFFLLIAGATIGLGQVTGRLFAAVSSGLEGYLLNIGGSLAGVLLFAACSWWLGPVWWFALVAAGLVYFLLREKPVRRWAVALASAVPLLVAAPDLVSAGAIRKSFPQEFWSPYYRVNYSPDSRTIVVNLLGHQNMTSRSDPSPAYALPYLLNRDSGGPEFRDILVVGAGSGNDVSRALQWASRARIDAVEIDPVIGDLGRRDHPDRPYQDPRVTLHLNDGRNFLRSTPKHYDLIVFALVDSLVLHSSVSNLRLESYLFTREALEDVRRRLRPGGLFVMYNYFRQGWIVARLSKTLAEVFGTAPLVLTMPPQDRIAASQKADRFTMLLEGERAAAIAGAFRRRGEYAVASPPSPASPDGFHLAADPKAFRFYPAEVEIPSDLRPAQDAWPFLYLRNPMIPDLSWRGVGVLGAVSFGLLAVFGWRPGRGQVGGLGMTMLLLGAGFMLLETKAVVHMALVFGGTWVVNTVVFSAVLVMILLANLWVLRRKPRRLAPFYAALVLALILNIAVPLDAFLGLPPLLQGAAAGALVLSPVLCAGVIFSTLFAAAESPEQALAYNTAGAILGGLAESASLLVGFQWLLALAGVIYLASWAFLGPARWSPASRYRRAGRSSTFS